MGGESWTDSKTGTALKVPGSSKFNDMKRDPYVDFVLLAKDLNATGVDLDYEEFWHADYFKTTAAQGTDKNGPWELDQTVYKYSAIAKDMLDAIDAHAPGMKLTTAAGAVGAWDGKWWGGNLKGIWLKAKQWFPEVMSRVNINVMTYDLSSNNEFHECPTSSACSLDAQVEFYMKTYRDGGFQANVGYEVGQPAYPDPTHDKSHQLPDPREAHRHFDKNPGTAPWWLFLGNVQACFWRSDCHSSGATDLQASTGRCFTVLGCDSACVTKPFSKSNTHPISRSEWQVCLH